MSEQRLLGQRHASEQRLLDQSRVPEDLQQAKHMLQSRFGKLEDLEDEEGRFQEFIQAFDSTSFHTFFALKLESGLMIRRPTLWMKAVMLPFMQIVVPLLILRETVHDNLDEDSDVGDVGYCPDNEALGFRAAGFGFMMYAVWSIGELSEDTASSKLMVKSAVFYQITGQRPSAFWTLGFFAKLACSTMLVVALYLMMVQAATVTDLTSYMYGVSFLIAIDGEWMQEGMQTASRRLAKRKYRSWMLPEESAISQHLHRDVWFRSRVVLITRKVIYASKYFALALGYVMALFFTFCDGAW